MPKLTTLAIASLVALALTSGAAQAASEPMHPKLVRTIMDKQLGEVLTTSNRQAIYVWRSEPRGKIRRPDGSRQLTLDRRARYTYAHEKPGQVLCNDVDNWFAVKITRSN